MENVSKKVNCIFKVSECLEVEVLNPEQYPWKLNSKYRDQHSSTRWHYSNFHSKSIGQAQGMMDSGPALNGKLRFTIQILLVWPGEILRNMRCNSLSKD